jgi:diguanylate cyclase (GGDEF)-like protein
MMPEISGIEACRMIRNFPQLADIPIIMITAKDDLASLTEAFEAGAMDYLVKPVNRIELAARIRSALSLKDERDRRKAREQDLLELTQKLAAANQMLRRLSVVDSLTGIANRRYFDEVLLQEWRRGRREQQPLSLIMIDIDRFKSYNDHLGHLQGDECLKKVAAALDRTARRPGDLLARYGGEEFVGILPNTGHSGAMELAEAMRSKVEELGLPHPESLDDQAVTVSLGVATKIPNGLVGADELVAAADQALYQAKADGRNRVSGRALASRPMADPAEARAQSQA